MSDIIFNITLNKSNGTLTVVDRGSDVDDINSLSILIKGEDKNTALYQIDITDPADIAAYLNTSVGLVFQTSSIFGSTIPDNFYVTEITANDSEIKSERRVFSSTDTIKKLIQNYALSMSLPINNVYKSLVFSMMLQVLELLELISDGADYTYDRENMWRKHYNHLVHITDVNKY